MEKHASMCSGCGTRVPASAEYKVTAIKPDKNGNSRRVIHFLAFITQEDRTTAYHSVGSLYELALKRARKLGGRKYHNKQYGGGIVFQAYSDADVYDRVRQATSLNPL